MKDLSSRQLLARFVEQAVCLSRRNLLKHATETEMSLSLHWRPETGTTFESQLPGDEELLKAFACDLRYFMQDNEPTSLRNLAKAFERGEYSKEFAACFLPYRKSLNDYLDQQPAIRVTVTVVGQPAVENPSRREILDLFMYGEFVHSTKRHTLDAIKQNHMASYHLMKHDAYEVMFNLAKAIFEIASNCRVELRNMETEERIRQAAIEVLNANRQAGQCRKIARDLSRNLRSNTLTCLCWEVEATCFDQSGKPREIKPHTVARCGNWLVDASLPTFSIGDLNLEIAIAHRPDFWRMNTETRVPFSNGCEVVYRSVSERGY